VVVEWAALVRTATNCATSGLLLVNASRTAAGCARTAVRHVETSAAAAADQWENKREDFAAKQLVFLLFLENSLKYIIVLAYSKFA